MIGVASVVTFASDILSVRPPPAQSNMAVEGELIRFAERYRSVVEQREYTDELIKVCEASSGVPKKKSDRIHQSSTRA